MIVLYLCCSGETSAQKVKATEVDPPQQTPPRVANNRKNQDEWEKEVAIMDKQSTPVDATAAFLRPNLDRNSHSKPETW